MGWAWVGMNAGAPATVSPETGCPCVSQGGGEAGPRGPAARVPVGGAAGKAGHGSCGPVFGEPRLELALPRPFESAGLSGALVGARKAPIGAGSGLCGPWAAPRGHFGCRNHAFGSQDGTCASEGPSGLTPPPPPPPPPCYILSALMGGGQGAGHVPLGAGPGSPPEPCTRKLAVLTCPAE